MNTFQITWDSKESASIDNEALRIVIVMIILNDISGDNLYQPTRSTIVFNSEVDFNTWKEHFSILTDQMYYSICQINPKYYHEERCKVDLSDTIKTAKAKLSEATTETENKLKKIVNETLNEIFINQNNPTNES